MQGLGLVQSVLDAMLPQPLIEGSTGSVWQNAASGAVAAGGAAAAADGTAAADDDWSDVALPDNVQRW